MKMNAKINNNKSSDKKHSLNALNMSLKNKKIISKSVLKMADIDNRKNA